MNLSTLETGSYWIKNAHVPVALLPLSNWQETREGLALVNIYIHEGMIQQVLPALSLGEGLDVNENINLNINLNIYQEASYDLQQGMILPGFVDIHTHLDKGQVWERAVNIDGTFATAVETIHKDEANWQPEELYRRMEFGLQCSYAHGTQALRTHLDAFGHLGRQGFQVFSELKKQWHDRLTLQAVALVSLDYYLTPAGVELADLVAATGEILGGVAYPNPNLDAEIDRVFTLAKERGLDLDFHVDETDNPESRCLYHIALAAIRHQFEGKITCGHCCSLAVQSPEVMAETLKVVKEVGISIVSLPMCNLFLQAREPGRTPRWRGVTAIQELQGAGIAVAIASDNCRDPFYSFGDHDMLEVLNQGVRIAHLDNNYCQVAGMVTNTAATIMGLPKIGKVIPRTPADLVLFRGRRYSELFARSQHDRIVLRNGKPIDTSLPDYSVLDDLVLR
ncbi:MAG: cytosine deaminase [Coleofasciculaceae cyanobacterium SM2_1_6]|nr:cytosine deaminase [Coleofasciculaceae cyanobacterium SM2_1_6]